MRKVVLVILIFFITSICMSEGEWTINVDPYFLFPKNDVITLDKEIEPYFDKCEICGKPFNDSVVVSSNNVISGTLPKEHFNRKICNECWENFNNFLLDWFIKEREEWLKNRYIIYFSTRNFTTITSSHTCIDKMEDNDK